MHNKKKNSHLGSTIFLVLLMIVTFYFIFRDHSIVAIFHVLKKANPYYLCGGVLLMFGYILLQALCVGISLKGFNCKTSIWQILQYSFIGFYFSAITPSNTGGQPVQMYYMCRDGIHLSHVSLSMLLTNLTYQITILGFSFGMYIFRFRFINASLRGFIWFLVVGMTLNLMLTLLIVFLLVSQKFAKSLAHKCVSLLVKIHIIKDEKASRNKIDVQLAEYERGAALIKSHPPLFFKVLGVTVLQMICYYLVPWFVYKAFGMHGASFLDLMAMQAVLYVAVSFLPLPGAVGASESGFVMLFRLFFTEAAIVPAMLLTRGINFYSMLLISGLVVVYAQLRKPYRTEKRKLLLCKKKYPHLKKKVLEQ
ncbi:MAG: lysylphosphatidylglycerol synthase transmembrane domain-containing protein [Oscillospiraceae bacterium]